MIELQGCHRSGNGQGKNLKGQGKVRKFYFEPGEIDQCSKLTLADSQNASDFDNLQVRKIIH